MTVLRGLTAKGLSDIGLVRKTNQDAYWCDASEGLFIVADGMGGHAGGEIASLLCVATIKDSIRALRVEQKLCQEKKKKNQKTLDSLAAAVNLASATIFARAAAEPALQGMGTTATVVLVCASMVYAAHVGDSRLYLYREGVLTQKTQDHSLVAEQVRAGLLSHAEAQVHQWRHMLTRCVGYKAQEEVDTFAFALQEKDMLLLCSDGLHGKVENAAIAATLAAEGVDGLESLNALAKAAGGNDNITIILAQWV